MTTTAQKMDHTLRLPFDVVAEVMACSEPSVITALMETCRLYYDEGPRHLLCDGVVLRMTMDVKRFSTFMFTPGNTRFRFLKQLSVSYPRSMEVLVNLLSMLAQLIQEAVYLEELSLCDPEPLLVVRDQRTDIYDTLKNLSKFYTKLKKLMARVGSEILQLPSAPCWKCQSETQTSQLQRARFIALRTVY